MSMKGKVVAVVGATSGIGRASAELFAEEGADLVLTARSGGQLSEFASELELRHGARVVAQAADASRAEEMSRLAEAAVLRFGHVDTLLYAAGAGALQPFAETGEEEFERLLAANVVGAFNACKVVLPLMQGRGRGHVIALPGILGRAPMAQAAAYCASKYALTGLLKSLALEYRRAGVRFTLLHLGGVNTPFWDSIKMRVQRERMMRVEAAARAVHFAAAQEGEAVLNEIVMQPESHQL